MLNRTKNTKLRKAILEYADADLISALCECAHNILRGTVRLTPREKVRLRKYKDKLRLIANRRLSISRRRREIQQHGGGSVVSSVGNHCLSTTSASTIRLNGTREEDGTTEASCCTKGWSYPAVTWSILSTIYYANVKRLTPSVGNSSEARCVQQTYPWNWSEMLLGGDTYSNGNGH